MWGFLSTSSRSMGWRIADRRCISVSPRITCEALKQECERCNMMVRDVVAARGTFLLSSKVRERLVTADALDSTCPCWSSVGWSGCACGTRCAAWRLGPDAQLLGTAMPTPADGG